MQLTLHANATTTPKTRAYIQASERSVAELAEELGVNETTIRRWRKRDSVADRSALDARLRGHEAGEVMRSSGRLTIVLT
jgi:transposase-like protein